MSFGTALGACFNPPSNAVMFACDPAAAPECPAGYTCEADGCCHRDGSDVSSQLGACMIGGPPGASTGPTTGDEATTDAPDPTTGTASTGTTTDATTTDAPGTTDATTADATGTTTTDTSGGTTAATDATSTGETTGAT